MAEAKKSKKVSSSAKRTTATGKKKPVAKASRSVRAKATSASAKIKKTVEVPVVHEGKITVFDLKGKTLETMALDPLFHEGAVNTDVIHQVVVKYQAGQREGTASTKTRGEVSGGGKKPWKQKHTGRARHASIRSPLWRGGGVTFGPHPRDYSYTLPLQIRRKAVAEGVKDKVMSGKLVMVSALELSSPKTKGMTGIFKTFKMEKPLVVVDQKSANVLLASRNIPYADVRSSEEVNVLDVVSHKECLMTKAAYSGLLKRLKS